MDAQDAKVLAMTIPTAIPNATATFMRIPVKFTELADMDEVVK